MGKLTEIIERLESATRADRDLDYQIHCRDGLWGVGMYGDHPYYTSSIDAALTLMPEGESWQARTAQRHENGFIAEVWVTWGPNDGRRTKVSHRYAAIALCITAPLALEAESGESRGH